MLPTTVAIFVFYVRGNVENHLNFDLETRIEVHFKILGPWISQWSC